MIVMDASLAAKLVIRETDTQFARTWFAGLSDQVTAPDLVVIEVAQAIVRRVNTREASPDTGRVALEAWRAILDGHGIALSRSGPTQVAAAADLALLLGHPVKDCIYLALAVEQNATLVTCDAKFARKAGALHPAVRLLSDYSS